MNFGSAASLSRTLRSASLDSRLKSIASCRPMRQQQPSLVELDHVRVAFSWGVVRGKRYWACLVGASLETKSPQTHTHTIHTHFASVCVLACVLCVWHIMCILLAIYDSWAYHMFRDSRDTFSSDRHTLPQRLNVSAGKQRLCCYHYPRLLHDHIFSKLPTAMVWPNPCTMLMKLMFPNFVELSLCTMIFPLHLHIWAKRAIYHVYRERQCYMIPVYPNLSITCTLDAAIGCIAHAAIKAITLFANILAKSIIKQSCNSCFTLLLSSLARPSERFGYLLQCSSVQTIMGLCTPPLSK